jgi:hypothetical protein
MDQFRLRRSQTIRTIILLSVIALLSFGIGLYNLMQAKVGQSVLAFEQGNLSQSLLQYNFLNDLAARRILPARR